MGTKTTHLQIRLAPAEKAAIQRAARRAGVDMSSWVISRLLPPAALRFAELVTQVAADGGGERFALAELNTFLAGLGAGELAQATASPPTARLPPTRANYLAAMVEYACARHGIAPPAWTQAIPPLRDPLFGSELASLRLYLLTHSPPPFRRRNIFIDATIGSQV
jgi:hypothetical protein